MEFPAPPSLSFLYAQVGLVGRCLVDAWWPEAQGWVGEQFCMASLLEDSLETPLSGFLSTPSCDPSEFPFPLWVESTLGAIGSFLDIKGRVLVNQSI